MIDFTELPTGESFEDLIQELLHLKRLHPRRAGRGPDRGRDFLIKEHIEGSVTHSTERRWVVQCKHRARSNRAISESDIGMIPAIVAKHKAHGYLLITSTRITINLQESIDALNDSPEGTLVVQYWTCLELERELANFPSLVRRYFPTSYSRSPLALPGWESLLETCANCVTREINASVGQKYIRDLYVERQLRSPINAFIANQTASLKNVAALVGATEKAHAQLDTLFSESTKTLASSLKATCRTTYPHILDQIDVRPISDVQASLEARILEDSGRHSSSRRKTEEGPDESKDLLAALALVKKLSRIQELVCSHKEALRRAMLSVSEMRKQLATCEYPNLTYSHGNAVSDVASTLLALIEPMRSVVDLPKEVVGLPRQTEEYFKQLRHRIDAINGKWGLVHRDVRPAYLVVDRAGGGKTNLVCRLAEEISKKTLCFFFSGQSIIDSRPSSITDYIDHTYPLLRDSDSTLSVAMKWSRATGNPLIFVVDAINESTDAPRFNELLKQLIKQLYAVPVKFIITCRDVYWKYFEDEFWDEHAEIARDSLYTFSASENRRVLPLYLRHYHIDGRVHGPAKEQLRHPLLLRFFCEAYKGESHESPSDKGSVRDIRLKRLFDDYATSKFRQIRKRMGLKDVREIQDYLYMIAQLILDCDSGVIPSAGIASEARKRFGATSITEMSSMYMQLTDEDIMIEQRPVGSEYVLHTAFVYDEFMEYTIAKSLYIDVAKDVTPRSQGHVARANSEVDALLSRRGRFISVDGTVEYFLTFVAEGDPLAAEAVVGRLVVTGNSTIACRAVSKWSRDLVTENILDQVLKIHADPAAEKEAEALAWRILEVSCEDYPEKALGYAMGLPNTHSRRPRSIYAFIGRACKTVEDPAQIEECVRWLVNSMASSRFLTWESESSDLRSGIKTLRILVEKLCGPLSARGKTRIWRVVKQTLHKCRNMEGAALCHNLRGIWEKVKNRSASWQSFEAVWLSMP